MILLFLLSLGTASEEKKTTYIVQVQQEAKPSIFPTHRHWYQSSLADTTASVIHTYQTVFHGFSARLSPAEAHKLHSLSHVITLIPEQVRQLHTMHSPQLLGLNIADRVGLLKEIDFGSDFVIDIGISPR